MKKSLACALAVAGLLAGRSVTLACEPILDILLFSDESPGKCPVPTTTPTLFRTLCFGGECRSFGGSDKGQYGQLKKDAPGDLEAVVFQINDGGNISFAVARGLSPVCNADIPDQTSGLLCDRLFKIKGVRPVGANLNSPLCTFDNIDDVNLMTTTNGIVITDHDGNQCESRIKPQYWLYYKICCSPGTIFGALGDTVDIDLNLVIDNGGVCSLDPVREDRPEVIPSADSNTCS